MAGKEFESGVTVKSRAINHSAVPPSRFVHYQRIHALENRIYLLNEFRGQSPALVIFVKQYGFKEGLTVR